MTAQHEKYETRETALNERPIYVTGHRNPDTDSVAGAIGYTELKSRLDPGSQYVPARLGDVNAQTEWALEQSDAPLPVYLPHAMLRVKDVMRTDFPLARHDDPVRAVGMTMARHDLDIVPVVDDEGSLVGVMTERVLAHRYIRESRKTSSLVEAPTTIAAILSVLDGELLCGSDSEIAGRVFVHSIDPARQQSQIEAGDVVVVGDRIDAQLQSIELGAALLVASNGVRPAAEVLERAEARGTCVIVSPNDSYVSSRMITLAAPCRALADGDPLTARPDDLLSDTAELITDVHYRAAVAVDSAMRPVGLITRSDLVSPRPRRVILVDHAEQAQSVPGVEEAEIVEILDHHHIGSIETRIPVRATFDPVGSTATLVVERFRQNGMEPSRPSAMMLLCAVLSDTVLLNSPTTTDRDRAVVEFLERALSLDAQEFGQKMFEESSDVSDLSAKQIVMRDAKEYELDNGQTISIAQVETVGTTLLERRIELTEALQLVQDGHGYAIAALMVTDILSKGTELLVSGEVGAAERVFGELNQEGSISLPGVMSRKKQVAPKLLAAF